MELCVDDEFGDESFIDELPPSQFGPDAPFQGSTPADARITRMRVRGLTGCADCVDTRARTKWLRGLRGYTCAD